MNISILVTTFQQNCNFHQHISVDISEETGIPDNWVWMYETKVQLVSTFIQLVHKWIHDHQKECDKNK